jgi:pilus assembly protein CpaB
MSKRLISVLIFAFVVSAGATLLVYRLVASRATAEAKQPTAQIILAAKNLPVGAMISEADLKIGAWAGALPAGALTKKEDAIARGVVAAIYEGEPLVESRLAPKGGGAGLAATIPPGMRAVAVKVNEVVGVAGFVSPGQRVDVLVTGVLPGAPAQTGSFTKTVLQNIEVLSAGHNIQRDAEGKPVPAQVVNLLVTPEQAEILSLISNEMRIQLVLRNPLDTKEVSTNGVAEASVFTGVAAPPEAPKPAPVRPRPAAASAPVLAKRTEPVVIPITVEVIQGSKRSSAKFEEKPANDSEETK